MAAELQFIISTEGAGRWDVSSEVRRFRFGTRSPGGFWEARVTLDTAPRDIWQYYHAWPGGTLTIHALGNLIWEGDLVGFRTLSPLTVIARGEVLRLRLPELWRVFANTEYRDWAPELGEERAFAVDNNNRLCIASNSGVIYEAGNEGVITYPEIGIELGAGIVRFEAKPEINLGYGPWIAELRDDAGATLWSTTTDANEAIDIGVGDAEKLSWALRAMAEINLAPNRPTTILAGIGGGNLSKGTYQYVVTLGDNNGESNHSPFTQRSVTDPSSNGQIQIDDIPTGYAGTIARRLYRTKVDGTAYYLLTEIGDNTTTSYTDNVADANLGAEIEEYSPISAKLTGVIVRTLSPTTSDAIIKALLDLKGIEGFDVQAPGLELDRASWQGVRPLVALEDVASLGNGTTPWLFTVYEHGAVYRAWSDDPDWILLPEDLSRGWDLPQDRDDVRNAVRAKLPDGTTTAWQTDADSITNYGRHEKTLDIPQTSQAEAVRYAQIHLEERKEPWGTIEAGAGEWIHKPDLTSWPAYFVRAGDVIAVRDVIPGEDIPIRVAETQYDGRRLRITPVGADNRLETLLAGLERDARRIR